ncbi:MAG: damage-inducible protein, partial [Polyangiaceae bacterium]|nr:damage-inducible protein [Polyangiaceae bacterium]
ITRLLQSGIIRPEDLARKYHREIHAYEIVLLAYYIASINIENVYHGLMASVDPDGLASRNQSDPSLKVADSSKGVDCELLDLRAGNEQGYASFPGICLTDTFQLGETRHGDHAFKGVFVQKSERVQELRRTSLGVIIGNPPYSIGQKSANDNAQNREYPVLEKRIRETYVAESSATLNKAAYDTYIKAFRWASDRLDTEDGGIIAFIANSGWIDSNGLDGFRRCIGAEFSSVYVLNLRGAVRGRRGEAARKEGNNVFDIITGVAITILVKRGKDAAKSNRAQIFYKDIGDYLSRDDKLQTMRTEKCIGNMKSKMVLILPNSYGDWLNPRSEVFEKLIPCEPQKKFVDDNNSFFCAQSLGMVSARDAWVYNFSIKELMHNVRRTIDYYSQQLELLARGVVTEPVPDASNGNWTRDWRRLFQKKVRISENLKEYRTAIYRPFCKQHAYFDDALNQERYQQPRLFPHSKASNYLICVPGMGGKKDFYALMVDCIRDLDTFGGTQCFPQYWYETDETSLGQSDLFADQGRGYVRRDGITDFIRSQAQHRYGPKVNKDDIFFYVYGILHSPSYRTTFANDLKKTLPRLPLVDSTADFWAFSNAGRALADLHLNYETRTPPNGVLVNGVPPNRATFTPDQLIVRKMSFLKRGQKDTIVYNPHIRVAGIPLSAYEYVINGRSAIEWIMDQYAVSVHKESGIVNDPNCWGAELGNPRYILDLLLSIIRVSVETLDIVGRLPTAALN